MDPVAAAAAATVSPVLMALSAADCDRSLCMMVTLVPLPVRKSTYSW